MYFSHYSANTNISYKLWRGKWSLWRFYSKTFTLSMKYSRRSNNNFKKGSKKQNLWPLCPTIWMTQYLRNRPTQIHKKRNCKTKIATTALSRESKPWKRKGMNRGRCSNKNQHKKRNNLRSKLSILNETNLIPPNNPTAKLNCSIVT